MSLATVVEYRLSLDHERMRDRRSWGAFFRHFGEMIVAMIAGMAVLGGVVSLAAHAAGQGDAFDYIWVRALVMAANMTIGMAAWMRFRGHSWRPVAEMSAAMFAPLAVLAPPYQSGALSQGALMGSMHMLMLPAMLVVMLARRDEYAVGHDAHGAATHQ
jgi:hypothetical protein